MSPESPQPDDVPIRDEVIRLGQFLKLANLVDQGSDVRPLLHDGAVTVNDEPETRRGRQLRVGDVVALGGVAARVVAQEPDEELGPGGGTDS